MNRDGAGKRKITLVEVTETADEVPLAFDIEFVSSTLSATEMPRFELTVRNELDREQTLVVDGGKAYVVPQCSEPSGFRTVAEYEYDEVPQAADESDENTGDIRACISVPALIRDGQDMFHAHPFEANEETRTEYAIVGSGGTEQKCPEPGRYELKAELHLNPPLPVSDGPELKFDWGFTIDVA